MFDQNNEPVYVAADSIGDYKFFYYVVKGNENNFPFLQTETLLTLLLISATEFLILKVSADGVISYIGNSEIIVPASNISDDDGEFLW
ncbi:MAG: hypothetical protein R3A12_11905 [Ignavibacteria bacterium]